MTARVLVVDDFEPNVKLLEAKLRAEYFDVIGAYSGEEAIQKARADQPDIILLDVMMPGMDGFEACRLLKKDPETAHIPVVMVTALDQQADRVAGLEAGADDFLTKPVEDVALFARVRSLSRLKMMTDELRMRYATSKGLGVVPDIDLDSMATTDEKGRIFLIDDQPDQAERLRGMLADDYVLSTEAEPTVALSRARLGEFDLVMVNMSIEAADPLRLCSSIRSFEETRLTPLLAIVRQGETRKLVRALELGVNDYLTRPIDQNELIARVSTQVRRKRYIEHLRSSFQASLEMAVTDQLTGLYNRRYLASHLSAMFDRAYWTGRPLSVMVLDIDHFKGINDTYGHDAGDRVLQHFAERIRQSVRSMDLACRYGGEEFLIAMPDTDKHAASLVAERIREDVAAQRVILNGGRDEIGVTVSIGIASTEDGLKEDSAQKLIKRADEALYQAKTGGRNRVMASAA
ncbi:PleD family two-component system response regulator [Amphiplicatus metriothermophilus]|uniref:diguanylate cyclase n=1 Tax=Amphiplicatus metriothermophilus TaxID=1519374 RepID=A0A239PNS7_9PROT|nr:PleD family two-component system response regulator [Amphiplicatus metriothermophilus]MBB5518878.1 two-component system cell cycle response regulator [Amphiplicatus metriothermophilus]SNT71969.1 response regulator receiver modulated diguanylate cyclase [Amphiplicatus metriothermophilus]